MSLAQPSSKSWWNGRLSSKHSAANLRENKSALNSFASAIGLRSKKSPNLPSLAIGDPQPVYTQPTPTRSTTGPYFSNRPPAKSISSTIDDRESSIGPTTPSDAAPRSRNSLLTLSDTDPFAATTRIIADPSRLSTYSDTSKPRHEQSNNRSSYASSSNAGHPSSNALAEYPRTHKLSLRSRSSFELEPPPVPKMPASALKAGKSQQSRRGQYQHESDQPLARPHALGRGMTDAASNAPRAFFDQQISPPTRPTKPPPRPDLPARSKSSPGPPPPPPPFTPPMPTVVVRQASLRNGLSLPPTAPPPTLSLPSPPLSATDDSTTPSESSISFASSRSSPDPTRQRSLRHKPSWVKGERLPIETALTHMSVEPKQLRVMDYDDYDDDIYDPVLPRGATMSRIPVSDQTPPLRITKTLKKATSHQTFIKGGNGKMSSFFPAQSPPRDNVFASSSSREDVEKSPRKHRPPHSHRHILTNFPSCSPDPQPSSPTFSRKRLFSSGSKRPSTATSILNNSVDDDDCASSAFSLPPEHDIITTSSISVFPSPPQKSSRSARESTAALSWNESLSSQPGVLYEYAPQRIMSPAEMLRVEASVLNGDEPSGNVGGYRRPRGVSITSTSTSTSWWEREKDMALNSTPSLHHGKTQEGLYSPPSLTRSISASVSYAGSVTSVPSSSQSDGKNSRPSTSQGTTTLPSLPPPPRRRPGTGSGGAPLVSSPSISFSVRSNDTHTSASIHSHSTHSTITSRSHAPTAYRHEELRKKRQSLMRKPSFLDIEDDEAEIVYPVTPSPEPEPFDFRVSTAFGDHSTSSSFLNLRDSFDTIRGSDE